jgi:hypothetical protein
LVAVGLKFLFLKGILEMRRLGFYFGATALVVILLLACGARLMAQGSRKDDVVFN